MSNFVKFNKIPYLEASLCEDFARWKTLDDLSNIYRGLTYLIMSSEMAAGAHTPAQATLPPQPPLKDVLTPAPAAGVVQDKGRVNQPNPFGFPED